MTQRYTDDTLTDRLASLDQTLHDLILTQLQTACEDPHTIMRTPVTQQTIAEAIRIVSTVSDLALVSTYRLRHDRDALALSWHFQDNSVSVDVSSEHPCLRDCYITTYQLATPLRVVSMTREIEQEDQPLPYYVKSRQRVDHLNEMELRYLLKHWRI